MPDASNHPDAVDPNVIASRLLQRAHNRDGSPEIVIGLFFLMASGLVYATAVLPKGTLGFGIAVLSFSFGLPVLIFTLGPLIQWVRRRCLIPREGYVQYRPLDKKRRVSLIILGLTTLVLMTLIVLVLPPPGSWYVALYGILAGIFFALCGRLPRFIFAGVLTALAGVLLAYVDISMDLRFAALFGFQGVVALISGGVTLVRFFNQPPIGAESNECQYPATQRS
jgi:MFS family permease